MLSWQIVLVSYSVWGQAFDNLWISLVTHYIICHHDSRWLKTNQSSSFNLINTCRANIICVPITAIVKAYIQTYIGTSDESGLLRIGAPRLS